MDHPLKPTLKPLRLIIEVCLKKNPNFATPKTPSTTSAIVCFPCSVLNTLINTSNLQLLLRELVIVDMANCVSKWMDVNAF